MYRSYSLYGRAYDEMKRAHELAPNDAAVQLLWFNALPQQDRIPAVEAYLADSAAQNLQAVRPLQQYLEYLKKKSDAPVHACKLVKATSRKPVPSSSLFLGRECS